MALACQLAARVFTPRLGGWAIFPWLLAYWGITGVLVAWGAGASPARWIAAPRGRWWWNVLALAPLPLALPVFLDGLPHLQSPWVRLPWLAFAPVHALCEEAYWRGLLLDAGRRHPPWLMIPYTALFFAITYTSLGSLVSIYRAAPPVLIMLGVGLTYGLVYWKTGSLRWVFAGHTLLNWLGLALPVLMNVYPL